MESFTQQYDVSVQRYTVKPQKDAGRALFLQLIMPNQFSSTVISVAHENSKLELDLGNGERVGVEAGNITCKVDKGENTMQVSINMAILAAHELNPEDVATRAKYLWADGTPVQPTLGESAALLSEGMPEATTVTVRKGGVEDLALTGQLQQNLARHATPALEQTDATPPTLTEDQTQGLQALKVRQLMDGLTKGVTEDDGTWDELGHKLSEQTLETLDGLQAQMEAGKLTAERVLSASDLSSMAMSAAEYRQKAKSKAKPRSSRTEAASIPA